MFLLNRLGHFLQLLRLSLLHRFHQLDHVLQLNRLNRLGQNLLWNRLHRLDPFHQFLQFRLPLLHPLAQILLMNLLHLLGLTLLLDQIHQSVLSHQPNRLTRSNLMDLSILSLLQLHLNRFQILLHPLAPERQKHPVRKMYQTMKAE